MRHVLEHCLDPLQILMRLADVLNDGGVLYIAVPDMMNPKGSLNKYWFRAVHTYYFSKQTLMSMAETAGLSPITVRSEKHEIWGFFKKADKISEEAKKLDKNIYKEQLNAIKKHKIRRTVNSDYQFQKIIISKIMSGRVKLYLKAKKDLFNA